MLETPQIIHTTRLVSAVISITVLRERIREVMWPGLEELRATIAAQGIDVIGPWFTHHWRTDPEVFDFEICVPVAAPVVAVGRMKPSEWPAMRVARTVYSGPFEGLSDAWGEFGDWIDAGGYKRAADLWERYLVGPETSPDPANWRTELTRPLVD